MQHRVLEIACVQSRNKRMMHVREIDNKAEQKLVASMGETMLWQVSKKLDEQRQTVLEPSTG